MYSNFLFRLSLFIFITYIPYNSGAKLIGRDQILTSEAIRIHAKHPAEEPTKKEGCSNSIVEDPCGPDSNLAPLYAYCNKALNDHYYTLDYAEYGARKNGYVLSRTKVGLWRYPKEGTTALYTYYNPTAKQHFYSTDRYGDSIAGYRMTGVLGYILTKMSPGTVPFYHFEDPDIGDNRHSKLPFDLPGNLFGALTGYVCPLPI